MNCYYLLQILLKYMLNQEYINTKITHYNFCNHIMVIMEILNHAQIIIMVFFVGAETPQNDNVIAIIDLVTGKQSMLTLTGLKEGEVISSLTFV